MASVSLPYRPSAKPFPFLDLPREIRDKIYGELLTVAEPLHPTQKPTNSVEEEANNRPKTNRRRFNIETQILQTCHSIKAEAESILLKSNLYIKIRSRVLIMECGHIMNRNFTLAVKLEPKYYRHFKSFVVSHVINLSKPLQEDLSTWCTYIILYRDLERFCSAIAKGCPEHMRHRDLMSHIVTICDPSAGSLVPDHEPFFSRGLQEKLMAPYRAALRDVPHFTIKGAIPQDLKFAAEQEIKRPFPLDPESVIREVEHLKAEGHLYFHSSRLFFHDPTGGASEYWNEALTKIQRVMQDDNCQGIRERGGLQFLNRLSALSFDLNSDKAQDYLLCMGHAYTKRAMDKFGLKVSDSVFEAASTMNKFPGSTWRPTPQQMAELTLKSSQLPIW
ncbi:uncharacterized protein LY89DRAFT_183206 [Mollisia scopiformis]|uniref:Uncharacterized protein n=1 Tax=Mollisia scopiformis TaxID=149040 RepID=A0A194XTD1_MOLSC|nr:uncharacterized protein LY89DRAFT_183206 [Mollisia scopiformis]KUJ23463.1 hypothetical protein LY89DRAFT_183206 [Mollisia scopiformis]